MIGQKRFPCRRRCLSSSYPIFVDGGFCDLNAEFPQLPDNPRRTPAGIGFRHLTDQCPDFFGYRRSTWPALLTQSGPMVAKALALPSDHCSRLNKDQRMSPTRPVTREPGPEQAVCGLNPGTLGRPMIDSDLMSQRNDLKLQGRPGSKQGSQEYEQRSDNRFHASGFPSGASMAGIPN